MAENPVVASLSDRASPKKPGEARLRKTRKWIPLFIAVDGGGIDRLFGQRCLVGGWRGGGGRRCARQIYAPLSATEQGAIQHFVEALLAEDSRNDSRAVS